jgi:hypothetical protein
MTAREVPLELKEQRGEKKTMQIKEASAACKVFLCSRKLST